jgi:hypothetical protein
MQVSKLFSVKTLLVLTLTVFAVSFYVLNPVWQIRGDGHGYYIYLRSLYFDHDLDFHNEISRYDSLYGTNYLHQIKTTNGKIGNPFAIGLSFFLLPFFLLARVVDVLFVHDLGGLGGFSGVYQLFLGLNSITYVGIGAVFLFLGLRRLFAPWIAWVSTLCVIFCSPLLHYVVYEPLMSHGASFLVCSLIFWYSIVVWQKEKVNYQNVLLLGILTGVAVLVRWEYLIFVLLPLYILFSRRSPKSYLLLFLCIVVAFFVPQALVWHHLFGAFFLIPQGSGFVSLISSHFVAVLFSPYHGLFSWHPMLFLCLVGLLIEMKKKNVLAVILLTMLFVEIYLHGSLKDWWGGSAFGNRKICGALFIFALGLAYLFERLKKNWKIPLIVACVAFAVWNLLLMTAAPRGFISISQPISYGELYMAPIKNSLSVLK